jgi:hypothetical protein
MPGWAIGNICIGLIAGVAFKLSKKIANKWLKMTLCLVAAIVGTAIGILCVKSCVESVLYAQPFVVRVAKNVYAFVADIVVLMISLPLCEILDPHLRKLIHK